MQLGFVSAILPELTLEQVFAFASKSGYDCVELMCWPAGKAERRYAGVTHLDCAGLTADTAKQTLDLAKQYSISISGLGYYPNVLDPDESIAAKCVAHIEQVILAADKLGIRRANTFIGRDWTKSVEDNWPRMLKTWRPLAKLAEDRDVRIGIENCPMLFSKDEWPGGKNLANNPTIWRRLFDELGSHVGLNYDPSHMVWQCMDYIKPIREFAGRLFHIHAKDVRVDRHKLDEVGILAHPNQYHTPKLPGLGDVNWNAFFSALTDAHYTGPVCVEVEDRAYEGSLERRQASLRQSLTYLRNFIPKPVHGK